MDQELGEERSGRISLEAREWELRQEGPGVNWNGDRKDDEKENEVKQTGTEGRRRKAIRGRERAGDLEGIMGMDRREDEGIEERRGEGRRGERIGEGRREEGRRGGKEKRGKEKRGEERGGKERG